MNGGPHQRAALVILVGVTAGRAQRRHISSFFAAHGSFDVFLPLIPFRLGLQACRHLLTIYLRSRVFDRGYSTVHFLNFIGGGFLFRALGRTLQHQPIGRTIYIRSPVQEQIPVVLARKFSRPGLMLLAGKTMADLSTSSVRSLPFPQPGGEKGLIVETGISKMARSLGLARSSLPASAWSAATLLPNADDVLEVPQSHDQIYEADEVLKQALTFFEMGHFSHMNSPREPRPPELAHAP